MAENNLSHIATGVNPSEIAKVRAMPDFKGVELYARLFTLRADEIGSLMVGDTCLHFYPNEAVEQQVRVPDEHASQIGYLHKYTTLEQLEAALHDLMPLAHQYGKKAIWTHIPYNKDGDGPRDQIGYIGFKVKA